MTRSTIHRTLLASICAFGLMSANAVAGDCNPAFLEQLSNTETTQEPTTELLLPDGATASPSETYVFWRITDEGKTIIYRQTQEDLSALAKYLREKLIQAETGVVRVRFQHSEEPKRITQDDIDDFIRTLQDYPCQKKDGNCSGYCKDTDKSCKSCGTGVDNYCCCRA